MILHYKTERLPHNFIFLGIILMGIGIWTLFTLEWTGIIFIFVAVLCLFTRSGILIDTDEKRCKDYTCIFMIKFGKWIDISSVDHLEIKKSLNTQGMSVLSISRRDTITVYKLFLYLPDKEILLMVGKKEFVFKAAEEISGALQTTINNIA